MVQAKKMSTSEELDIGKFLFKAGAAMAEAAPSTMGNINGKRLYGSRETIEEQKLV